MLTDPLIVLGRAMSNTDPFCNEELFRWIEFQAKLGSRRPGSPAGKANEDFIFSQLEDFGLSNVRRESVPVTHWQAEEAALHLGANSFSVFGIPYTAFSPDGGVAAPLVYAAPDCLFGRADWKGKIVVAEIGFPPLDTSLLLRLALGKQDSENSLPNVTPKAEKKLRFLQQHFGSFRPLSCRQ